MSTDSNKHLGRGGIPKIKPFRPIPGTQASPLKKYELRLFDKLRVFHKQANQKNLIIDPLTGQINEDFRIWLHDNRNDLKYYFNFILKSIEKHNLYISVPRGKLYKDFVAFCYTKSTFKSPREYQHLKL